MNSVLDHIHIHSASVSDSLRFYQEVLGADYLGAITNAQGDQNHLLILGGQNLAISAFPAGIEPVEPPPYHNGALETGHGIAHFGLNVDDLDPILRKLEQEGVAIHGEPTQTGPVRYIYFSGPDGVVVELTQYVLPPKLRPFAAGLSAFNKMVHLSKRTIARRMLNSL